MEQTASSISIPADLTALYEQLKAMMLPEATKIDYTPRSRAELRAGLEATLMPNYQAAVKERQTNTQRTNANIDADAAARGIGASTWGSDVKNRNYGSEAKDISSMRGEYNSTLANNLNSLMSEQESRKLSADQYNKSSEASALSNALSMALGNYDKWGTSADNTDPGNPNPATPKAETFKDYLAELNAKNPNAYTTSYDAQAGNSQQDRAAEIIKKYRAEKYGNTSQILRN